MQVTVVHTASAIYTFQYQYQSWIYIAHKRKASNALVKGKKKSLQMTSERAG